jgi:thiamine biosynthesis lipoprotein
MKKRVCFLLLSLLAVSSGCRKAETWHKSTLLYFDTVCELNLLCSAPTFAIALEKANQIFSEIEDRFSPGKDDLSSRWALNLFQKAQEVYQDSNGSFDITVAPLSRLWGFLSGSYIVPDQADISSALELTGMEKIEIKDGRVYLAPGMSLDWGGIAKGFGIDLAALAMFQLGISQGFINAGGDLYCWGSNPEEQPWQIGIKHPRQSGFLGVLSISGLGAATTGDYQRFFIESGIRYHHVFDPRTGYPARSKQSVTVIGPEACLCDALSTALFVSQAPALILEKYPEYGAILVDSRGKISSLGEAYPFRVWD